MPLIRDPEGEWASASWPRRIVGLGLGLLISLGPLVLLLIVLALAVTRILGG